MSKLFTFISFNIKKKSQLFEDLMSFVSTSSCTVIGVQEMPNANSVSSAMKKYPQVNVYQNYDIAFLASTDLNIIKNGVKRDNGDCANIRKRTIALTIPFKEFSLNVLNVHGFSKTDLNNSERKNACLFRDIDCIYGIFGNRIYMGDFNTDPYEFSLTSKKGLNSYRLKGYPKKNGMYNPFWNYYSESVGIWGSNYFKDCDHQWQILDQIMVSKSMAKKVNEYRILESIGSIKCDFPEFQEGHWITDHLPVLLKMEM